MFKTCHKFQSGDISVFETNIRYVGGLLSAYALTGDDMFRDKALHVAEKLTPAFKSPTGIPFALINMRTGVSRLKAFIFHSVEICKIKEKCPDFSFFVKIMCSMIYRI